MLMIVVLSLTAFCDSRRVILSAVDKRAYADYCYTYSTGTHVHSVSASNVKLPVWWWSQAWEARGTHARGATPARFGA